MNVVEACVLLHTAPGSTDAEIKQNFRIEAMRWHPDRGGDTEAMRRMIEARDYLLSMPPESCRGEWRRLKSRFNDIAVRVDAETDAWEARLAARASVTNIEPSTPEPDLSVTNKRRAAGWEARNKEKVREQTNARVKKHRARNPDRYKEYMREYMKRKRSVTAHESA